ncbi:MAG: SIMPL domain-containing protein [Bacteroidetes bacterium]|nr:SIMPL domain-containing protein [Bacteroidota bacterium]
MKAKTEGTIVVLLVVGLIAMGAFAVLKPVNINLSGKISGGGNTVEQENSIQVSGYSILSVDPDKAEIILGVETQEENALDSQQGNAEIMEKIMNALRANGIKKQDIKTHQYNVYPIRNWRSEKDYYEVIGYKTTHMVKVKTTDLDNVGKVIDAAVSAGANSFQGVSFGLTDEKQAEYINEVLKEAAKNAGDRSQTR